jgi:chromosome segregation protein
MLAFVPDGARLLRDVVRVNGPHAAVVSTLLGNALIVESFDMARSIARDVAVPVATTRGEVFHGAHLVEIGSRPDVHGILETRGDIDRLRDEITGIDAEVHRLSSAVVTLDVTIAADERTLADHVADQHAQEKGIVGFESQVTRGEEEIARVTRRLDVVATERRRAEEEERTADTRREGAAAAITEYEAQQEGAEDRLNDVMVRLHAARDQAEGRLRLVTESRTEQATLSERASALDIEVVRLEAAAGDLDERLAQREGEIARTEVRTAELRQSIADTFRLLDEDIRVIDALKLDLRAVDERVAALRGQFGSREQDIRGARKAYEIVRSEVTQSEVARATAASNLAHLASACQEAINLAIDDVLVEVARMEADGELVAPAKRIAALAAPDDDEFAADTEIAAIPTLEIPDPQNAVAPLGAGPAAPDHIDSPDAFSVEEIVAELRRKIEKLGPVNMMAIEQFDELESRHSFLTTQRKDLLDSISQTGEAIRKIDKTTRERFEEAFASIKTNFQVTFTTLFGGGRAGLVLIDQENDAESGIDIIAQPPGKRLQNVQLLSGGEKALTAMALMFAIFKYRPSPFCLLDEIDAPLDDANIGRFVEMLQSMQSHTQFILITHNRKTMEIADRLYGVTMEEPGVSKLISLQF